MIVQNRLLAAIYSVSMLQKMYFTNLIKNRLKQLYAIIFTLESIMLKNKNGELS